MRPTIALAIISLNEEKNLSVLLESFKDCVDAIYLTDDTKTTDGTREIARRYGAKIFDVKWEDNFSYARNISFEPIKEDYILWADCDDSLVNKEAFLHWRDHEMFKAYLWMIPYRYSDHFTLDRERVVKNIGFRWKYFVHEGIDPLINGKVPPCGRERTWMIKHRRTDFLSSNKRNLRLFDMNLNNLDPRMTFYYGKELFANGQYGKALKYLNESVVNPNLDKWDKEQCENLLGYLNSPEYAGTLV